MINSFFQIIRTGLYGSVPGDFTPPAPSHWQDLCQMAVIQRVTGIFARGVELLPDDVDVPADILARLLRHESFNSACLGKIQAARRSLAQFLQTDSFIVCKGPVVADYYPLPQMRESGDLDIYLPEPQFSQALERVRQKGIPLICSPDGSAQYYWEDVLIDQHKRYFDLHCRLSALPPVPSAYATLVMLSAHIMKHALSTGVGVRQLCDMVMAYKNLQYDKDTLLRHYRKAVILRWNRVLSSFLAIYLDYDNGLFSRHSEKDAFRLLMIVLEGGDFGLYAPGRSQALRAKAQRRKRNTFRQMLQRLPLALRWAPREYTTYTLHLLHGNLLK